VLFLDVFRIIFKEEIEFTLVNFNSSTNPQCSEGSLMSKKVTEDGLDPNRWRALAVIAIAQLMVVLDASIVNIAIPSAQRDLHISAANRQWVVTAYTLAFGSLLLLGGRIADVVGRKKIFITGLIGFAAASALGGIASTQGLLFAARGLQGVFGALLAPAALSLINVTFTLPKERAKAFGVYGAIAGGGAAIGLIMGGTLTQYASWRWCLGVNVPIALLAVSMAVPWLHESHAEGENAYDIPGAVTVSLGLLSLVYGLSQAATKGWAKSSTYQYFIIAAVLLVLFFIIESRVKHPLLPVRVLAERNRGGSYLATLLIGSGLFTMFLFLSIYFQNVLGYSALKSGFAFLPFSLGVITFAGVASTLLPKVGARPLMLTGLLMATIGLFYLSRFTPHSSYLTAILPALIIMSTGLALVFIPSATTGLHGIGGRDSGVASAMINTSQQIGGSLGAALLNTVAVTASTSFAASHTSLGKALPAFAAVHGFSTAFRFGAIFLAVAAVIIALTINVGKHAAEGAEGVVLH